MPTRGSFKRRSSPLTEDLQDYKRLLNENGFNVEEEEVAMEE
jgi:hypothetical protein